MPVTTTHLFYATVAYADIFDFPLREDELRQWFIHIPLARIPRRHSSRITRVATNYENYFVLRGREKLVSNYRRRLSFVGSKWRIAQQAAAWLRLIPTITLVGVTGGLSRHNVDQKDDIDLLVVTAPGTLWSSRLLSTLLLDIIGWRRRPGDRVVADKICLNMFMSEEMLAVPLNERDLFAAHEVLQMRPLWERGGTYRKFLKANAWVKKFLPNAWAEKHQAPSNKYQTSIGTFGIWNLVLEICLEFGTWCLRFVEIPSRVFQLWYMRRRRTREVIGESILRFHPKDARIWVKEEYAKRLTRLKIPLDKIW